MKIKFVIIVILINFCLHAQKSTEYDNNIPLPPEAYQFKKRLQNNVSLYTGQPSIDVPLYVINLDGMEVPISISYSTGGIKVEEEATSVGLGWSLNIGGQISRNNHGLPDERYFISKPYNAELGIGSLKETLVPNNQGNYVACAAPYTNRVAFYDKAFRCGNNITTNYTPADSRPDEFYYSLFGHSGKFMYSQQFTKFITFPLDDISINYELGVSQGINFFDNFNIKLPNGFSLILGKDGRSAISEFLGFPFDQSWQLKKITSPKGKEIVYNYISANYNLFTNLSSTVTHIPGSSVYNELVSSTESNKTNNKEKLVSEISFSNGKISFIYGDRVDLQTGSKRLQEIRILDNSNNLIKKIELVQSYFNANINLFGTNDAVNKRLKLDAVKFYDTNNTIVENYNFDYYQFDKIPSKYSKAQDHWGYFNGKDANVTLLPKNLIPSFNVESGVGFNRDIDTLYTKTFSLKSVRFPEGGVKYYNYENHKVLPGTMTNYFYKNILNDQFDIKEYSLNISGYNLNYFYPLPNEVNTFNKVFYSSLFEVNANDTDMRPGELNLLIKSNLPFQVPNYSNINVEYNNISFYIEKKQDNGTYTIFSYLGTISKSQNATGIINSKVKFPIGIYRLKTVIVQNYLLSDPSSYNYPHSTSFKIKYRRKVRDEIFVGGLRIKDIKTYNSSNLNDVKYITKFFYLDDNNLTSGRAVNAPSYGENASEKSAVVINSGQGSYTVYNSKLVVKFSSSSILPLYKTSGSNVGYSKVSQIDYDNSNGDQIKEDNYFSFFEPLLSDMPEFDYLREFEPKEWQRGKLIKKASFSANTVVKEEIYKYYGDYVEQNMGFVDEINYELMDKNELCAPEAGLSKHMYPNGVIYPNAYDNVSAISYNLNKYTYENSSFYSTNPINLNQPIELKIPYFKIYTGFDKLKSKITKNYFQGNVVEQKEEYLYNNTPSNIELTSIKNSTSLNSDLIETKYFYPQDTEMVNEPFRNEFIVRNMIGLPLKTETFKGAEKLSEQTTKYNVFPSTVSGQTLLLPQFIYGKKGSVVPDQLEKKITYDQYDTNGTLLQYTSEGGMSTVIIWGYNKTLPIAKIENTTYSQVTAYVANLQMLSNTDTEANLLLALDNLRNASEMTSAIVTTYTYKPLVGVSTITDAKGDKIIYSYDGYGRLQNVKDKNGNVLTENEYHYKP
ncbi:RHS repeat protein [Flavobacterium sp. AED]|uniref:RHS repeat protein n=1 Tax=Flavobacterium sp. AED TaxID=1423323 RepID=UPI00057D3374|nr:RHS repeat protein [Flavobacterium sp. AED]KIA82460.1 hypothetical protein OA85_16490 [Flavobacterium sp. AED]